MDLILIICIGLLIGSGLGLSWFAGSDAPYVATRDMFIKKILQKAGLTKDKIFYELGSGDGRVVFEAAKLSSKAFGVEQSWIRVWYSRYKAKQLNLENAIFFHGDIFQRNYYSADIVYIYLLPKGVDKLEKKLKKELKKGSIIITQTYHFKNWKAFLKIQPTEEEKQQLTKALDRKAGDFWLYRK
jgi:SAM-dependent methyltransferase